MPKDTVMWICKRKKQTSHHRVLYSYKHTALWYFAVVKICLRGTWQVFAAQKIQSDPLQCSNMIIIIKTFSLCVVKISALMNPSMWCIRGPLTNSEDFRPPYIVSQHVKAKNREMLSLAYVWYLNKYEMFFLAGQIVPRKMLDSQSRIEQCSRAECPTYDADKPPFDADSHCRHTHTFMH